MKLNYKEVKIAVPHCGDCWEMLKGLGNNVFPYECSCGVWKYDYILKEFKPTSISRKFKGRLNK